MVSEFYQYRWIIRYCPNINAVLKGDLAIIKVPMLQTDHHIKPLVLPKPPYYPNGKIILSEHFY